MTSKKNAIYQKSILLSDDDLRIKKFQYKNGNKFLFKGETDKYTEDLAECLIAGPFLIKISSYHIFQDGSLGYMCDIIYPKTSIIKKWALTEDILNEDFHHIDKKSSIERFLKLLE